MRSDCLEEHDKVRFWPRPCKNIVVRQLVAVTSICPLVLRDDKCGRLRLGPHQVMANSFIAFIVFAMPSTLITRLRL